MLRHPGRPQHDDAPRTAGTCVDTPTTVPARLPKRLPQRAGFTLVEMLVATVIGGVLLMTAAYTAGAYSQAVAALRTDDFSDHETAMARIMQDVRYAWWVQLPSASEIEIGDNRGRVRSYELDSGNIVVTDHDNTQGVLCGDVASLTLEGLPIQRLREATPVSSDTVVFARNASRVVDKTLVIGEGGSIALPFMFPTDAGVGSVPGLREQVLDITPTSISVPVTSAFGLGTLEMQIYPARAPGDPRPIPGAAPMGSFTMSISGLPAVTQEHLDHPWHITDMLKDMYGLTLETRILGIKVPIPMVTQSDLTSLTSKVSSMIVDSGYNPLGVDVVKEYSKLIPSSSLTPLNTAGRFSPLKPGTAYTLVISVTGQAGLSVVAAASSSSEDPLTAIRKRRSAALANEGYQVPFAIAGTKRVTATTATDSVAVVHATLVPGSGTTLTKATPVYSQVLAPDPWQGVLPGETSP